MYVDYSWDQIWTNLIWSPRQESVDLEWSHMTLRDDLITKECYKCFEYLPNKTHLVFIWLSIHNWLIKLQCGHFHTGKKASKNARHTGIHSEHVKESKNQAHTESPTKNIRNLPSTMKRFTLQIGNNLLSHVHKI